MAIRRSLWLDATPRRNAGGGPAASSGPSWVTGRVTEILDGGWVEVEIPADNPVNVATGPTDGTFTEVGALVRVMLDGAGRVLQIAAPSDFKATPVPTGATGRLVAAASSQIREALDTARSALAGIRTAEDRASDAATTAEEALRSATEAVAAAVLSIPPLVQSTMPGSPKDGQIWFATNQDNQISGVRVWDGEEWIPYPLVGDSVLVPGSAGTISLKDGAVTAPKIYASTELWAKIARFGSVTTEMLTAGRATVSGTAVVGELIGNVIRGSTFSLLDRDGQVYSSTPAWPTSPESRLDGSPYITGFSQVFSFNSTGVTATITRGEAASIDNSSDIAFALRGGPQTSAGAVTVEIDLTAVGYSSSFEYPTRVEVFSNTRRFYGEAVQLTSGVLRTVRITLPEGEYLAPSGLSIWFMYGGRARAGAALRISRPRISWSSTRQTGLSIYRDATGRAKIDIKADDGTLTTLSSSGVSIVSSSGLPLGGSSWTNFVSPPMAVAHHQAVQTIQHAAWTSGNFSGSTELLLSGLSFNGSTTFTVREAGWYRLSARVKFDNGSTAVGRRAVGFSINGGSPSVNTFAVPTTGTFSVECSTFERFAVGDTIALQIYQESGAPLTSGDRQLSIEYRTK